MPSARTKFLAQLLSLTEHPIYACSLPNKRGDRPGERHVLSRDAGVVEKFCEKWDRQGRGLFYCVSPIRAGKPRLKENVAEVVMLHADVDGKAVVVPLDDVEDLLRKLPVPPTRLHRSGNGLHAIWLLKEPAAVADAEPVLKELRRVLSGDAMVTHAAALLRMPGSHNTKDGAWKEVTVAKESGKKYSLEQVRAWAEGEEVLVEPRSKPRAEEEDSNPYLRMAREFGFRPPMDVDKSLSEMAEGNIHDTQLKTVASLLSTGSSVEETVERVMEATRKVGQAGWDWAEEEKAIRGMCRDWLKKHPPKVVRMKPDQQEREEEEEEPAAEEPKRQKKVKQKEAHVALGRGLVKAVEERGEKILYSRDQLWLYQEGLWTAMDPAAEKGWVEREVEAGCRALNLTSTQRLVSETRAWLRRDPDLYLEDAEWDDHGKIATLSGLVDWETGEVTPPHPDQLVTRRIDCDWDPGAECPWWLRMLGDVFPDQDDKVGLIQEVLGAGLVQDRPRTLMRALVLVGSSNAGKSSILNVLSGLFTDEPNTTPFDALENAHGLMPFLRSAPWLLHEAFDQAKWHFSATAKALLSADQISVNVKNGPIVTTRFRSPVFWGTNTSPQFKEASRAMEYRLIILRCTTAFSSRKLSGAAAEAVRRGYGSAAELVLAEERAGVLAWAVEGLKRAWKRGAFAEVAEAEEALEEMRLDSNLAVGFFDECLEFSPDHMVAAPDFCGAFTAWWQENHGTGRGAPSNDSIGRAVFSMGDARVMRGGGKFRHNMRRQYVGVKLNETGLDFWQAYAASRAAVDGAARLSSRTEEVNQEVPREWDDRPEIRHMRKAHA